MTPSELDFYAAPAPMSELPDHVAVADLPTDLAGVRRVVQGILVHRDFVPAYGITPEEVRLEEQNLRGTTEVLDRVMELSPEPLTVPRPPAQRVQCICSHFALVYAAFLRAQGVPARERCGFANYFDADGHKWYDHWITERWDGSRWVRDDPQVDEFQASQITPGFDVNDQPPGYFLSGAEAWTATREGKFDPLEFGIFDMWGQSFIGGNVLSDLACLNKVELLPWDGWGMGLDWGPHDEVPEYGVNVLDDIASVVNAGDFAAIRSRYLDDERLRVPDRILTFSSGAPVEVDIRI